MVAKSNIAKIMLWDEFVGAVAWQDGQAYGVFEYDNAFLKKGLDISPLHMGIQAAARSSTRTFTFPALNKDTYKGLPGLLADALPDDYGNAIINAWLARLGRSKDEFSPVERLLYTGKRGMGALEFEPSVLLDIDKPVPVEIQEMVKLVQQITAHRDQVDVNFSLSDKENEDALKDIIRIGTSAGGARAKAVIAINRAGRVLSGQGAAPKGYTHWLLKFDGVTDLELGESRGYGRIEYAYYLMALAAKIKMSKSRLLEENGRAHFMTRRFDRPANRKVHVQTLCGLAHYDFRKPGAYGYEQAFSVMRQLRLSKKEAEQLYRRMVFNVLARNQDDHTKNISFVMDEKGVWKLSPAYDMTYSHNPKGEWTSDHQMSINGKRNNFLGQDLIQVGVSISLSRPQDIMKEVADAVSRWPEFAREAGMVPDRINEISQYHRLHLAR